ncbi:NADH-quinone oxidoreductase subunit L [Flaviflexus ciconiae]|uniref:NADH-quinone oxidoreductase subunit L n=1 Tax=Flaviflexus ciconiae TaxID=2496867 RepID=UPI001D18E3A6|nr:NADH-quinone oxidoreductase subunit L [Flaviflexus ciconiae]
MTTNAIAATGNVELIWLAVAIPLVSAGILLLAGKGANRWGHWLGILASLGSLVIGVMAALDLLGQDSSNRIQEHILYEWIPGGDLDVALGFRVDPLSITFVLLVTFVGTLIHIYSVAYMEKDRDRRRFFAYLNLFVASMLLLVLGNSYLVLFVGWEGVGLASYLLIGFWNQVPEYATAGKKAFVMNRVGDMGMLLAMMTMFASFGTVSFDGVAGAAGGASEGVLTAIGIFLLVAACGKSAQFPLQAWLGDAMAGPTPVSALIHAATMVTAGVYLMVRSGFIFEGAPTAQLLVAIIGTITLIFGAIVGSAKDDMKKVLAASTMSQIGYMMLAAGLGPIGAAFAIFHLVTHGFFKAGMFLGAGSVMHAMNDEVDMRGFGGLWKHMKVTWVTFGLGYLAIIGFPFLSGFYSKDYIIEAAFVGEGWQPWVFGTATLLVAGLTAFYMSRLFFMVFHGKPRWSSEGPNAKHPHESPALMTIPMIILAIGSVGLGWFLDAGDRFVTFLEPVTGAVEHLEPVIPVPVIIGLTLTLVAIGVAVAYVMYVRNDVPAKAPAANVLVNAARNDLHQDAINENLFMRPGQWLTRGVDGTDRGLIDGLVMAVARSFGSVGRSIGKIQNGYARSYAGVMTLGIVVVVILALAARI